MLSKAHSSSKSFAFCHAEFPLCYHYIYLLCKVIPKQLHFRTSVHTYQHSPLWMSFRDNFSAFVAQPLFAVQYLNSLDLDKERHHLACFLNTSKPFQANSLGHYSAVMTLPLFSCSKSPLRLCLCTYTSRKSFGQFVHTDEFNFESITSPQAEAWLSHQCSGQWRADTFTWLVFLSWANLLGIGQYLYLGPSSWVVLVTTHSNKNASNSGSKGSHCCVYVNGDIVNRNF